MTFDPAKPVQTRDGRPARIICIDARGSWPIIALVTLEGKSEATSVHREEGSYNSAAPQSPLDLINVPEKRTLDIWVDINSFGHLTWVHDSKGAADELAHHDRIACVHIKQEYTVGEGMP